MTVPCELRDAHVDSSESSTPLRFLTTHHKNHAPAWLARMTLLPGWYEEFVRRGATAGGLFRSALWSWRLFRASRHYDGVATGSEHVGHFFALLQSLLRRPRNRVPHVMIDFPWADTPSTLRLFFKRIQIQIEARSLTRVLVLSGGEDVRFASAFRTRDSLFRFVSYHHTVRNPQRAVTMGDYIFSGGTCRDYATLLRAIGTRYKTLVCVRDQAELAGLRIPPNVSVLSVDPDEFERLLAGAAVVVVPLPRESFHTGGHTVIANAMTLGKPVIVAGDPDYDRYIADHITGIITPPGDSAALAAAIDRVMHDKHFAGCLSANARAASHRFAPQTFFQTVFDELTRAASARRQQ